MRGEKLQRRIDWLTVALYAILVFGGWISIYAADYDSSTGGSIFNLDQNAGKQFIWILSSVVLIVGVFVLDGKMFETFSWVIRLPGFLKRMVSMSPGYRLSMTVPAWRSCLFLAQKFQAGSQS